jgi:hypothetical protein
MSSYTITDRISGTEYHGIDRYEIADTLRGLFPEAPAETTEQISLLESKLHRGDYYGDEEAYLQVAVEREQ